MQATPQTLIFGRDLCGQWPAVAEHEWLVVNGLGGFAAGTVAELNTRRYHGLLVAALAPPVERTLLVAKLDITAHYQGQSYPLFSNEFADGTVSPQGYVHLESFALDDGMPVWRYAFADVLLEKRVLMQPQHNGTQVQLRLLRAQHPLELTLLPLCTYRDYHNHGCGPLGLRTLAHGVEIHSDGTAPAYQITCAQAQWQANPEWYWHFKHRVETERGLDDTEDLFSPGQFQAQLHAGASLSLSMDVQTADPATFTPPDFSVLEQQQRQHVASLVQALPTPAPAWIQQLAVAADQFIVERYQHGQPAGKTVIAGYPWFSDWGRDTMIALPGLTLVQGRFAEAASILRTFAQHVSQGMLPNRFPDQSAAPEYNTADASLWYIHAVQQYNLRSGDITLVEELFPVLQDIVHWHQQGTRYGIRVDPADGLLCQGETGVQLTWMDAKVGNWVVTPRHGKAVEINALWFNALNIMAALAQKLGRPAAAWPYQQAAAQVQTSFQRFWNPGQQALFDVIDGPEGQVQADGQRDDDHGRPNQIFAVSLPFSPLPLAQQQAVLENCMATLLTSHGLRSLSPQAAEYTPYYQGNPWQRDGAYHQGTVWAWLLGPLVDAHWRVHQDLEQANLLLAAMALHLQQACIGQISEIFDAQAPHQPRGCFAQAWSVAEVLRAWVDLNHPGGRPTS